MSNKKTKPLTEEELKKAQALIDKCPEGLHELRKIYGDEWKSIQNPNVFGSSFLNAVRSWKLQYITSAGRNMRNHQEYIIEFDEEKKAQTNKSLIPSKAMFFY